MRLAFTRDPCLRVVDFTYAVRQLDQLGVEDFAAYGLESEALDELAPASPTGPATKSDDDEGQAVDAAVAAEERRNTMASPSPSTATLAGQAYPTGPTTRQGAHGLPSNRPSPEGRPPYRSA